MIWITGAFHISPISEIEAIVGPIPIYLHLQKLNGQFLLWVHLLPPNYIINLILKSRDFNTQESHCLSLNKLTLRQYSIIKGPLVNIDNRFNKVFPSFSPFNYEFSLENKLIDVFPNCFSFYSLNRKNNYDTKSHLQCLNNITIQVLSDLLSTVVVTDRSIKN